MDLPTHRNTVTGDIVFWGEHLDPKEHELLPPHYWQRQQEEAEKINKAAKAKLEREAKFAGWTIEEVAVYFEDKLKELKK